jgi:histidinol dehydrogenase
MSMMRRIEIEAGRPLAQEDLARAVTLDKEVMGTAARIVDDVRARGDEALRDYTSRLDGVDLDDLRVTDAEIEAAVESVDETFRDSLLAAAVAIEDFHSRQIPQSWFNAMEGGVLVGQKVTPIGRVGIYVPGGRACYPSTVLMNAIPAIVAGVEEVAMVVPPADDGSVSPYTLAAAA